MAKSYNRYEYETSPRKLEPDYDVPKKKEDRAKREIKTTKKKGLSKKQQKAIKKKKIKTTMWVLLGFTIVFLISSRNAKIDENFAQVRDLKEELAAIEKENAQLEVSIESSLNLTNIKQQAKSLLGMQELTNRQTVYIELPKSDYIEPAAEDVVIEEEKRFLEKAGDFIMQLFK